MSDLDYPVSSVTIDGELLLIYRQKLRAIDPSLPDPSDGGEWWKHEASWLAVARWFRENEKGVA